MYGENALIFSSLSLSKTDVCILFHLLKGLNTINYSIAFDDLQIKYEISHVISVGEEHFGYEQRLPNYLQSFHLPENKYKGADHLTFEGRGWKI